MKSLAIWFTEKTSKNVVPEIDLHFNHWKFKIRPFSSRWFKFIWKSKNFLLKQNFEYILDFGLMVKNGSNIQSIYLFLPFEFEKPSDIIEDLGNKLLNQRLLTAVFNEKYDPRQINGEKYFEVKKGEETKFNIYVLDTEYDLESKKKYGGTILKISFNQFNNKDTYYRIRFKTDFVMKFSRIYRPKNNFLESAFSSIELIDFRVNDTRNMDLNLLKFIKSEGKYFNISLIHFFIMRNIDDEYILSDLPLHSIRQLEENTWNAYFLNSKIKYKNTIAYHLKVKETKKDSGERKFIEDYNALLTFRFGDSQLLKYFLYLVAFALLSEVIGSGIYDITKPSLKDGYDYITEFLKSRPDSQSE